MEDGTPIHIVVAIAGFAAGIIFGAVANKTNFCTMGAVSDMVFMGCSKRFRAWMMAIGVAILGTQALHISGEIDVSSSIYLTSNFGWAGAIIGGLLFGYGSQLGRGCTSGAALTGMGVLSVAGFVTMAAIFGTAFAFAYVVRKNWI